MFYPFLPIKGIQSWITLSAISLYLCTLSNILTSIHSSSNKPNKPIKMKSPLILRSLSAIFSGLNQHSSIFLYLLMAPILWAVHGSAVITNVVDGGFPFFCTWTCVRPCLLVKHHQCRTPVYSTLYSQCPWLEHYSPHFLGSLSNAYSIYLVLCLSLDISHPGYSVLYSLFFNLYIPLK